MSYKNSAQTMDYSDENGFTLLRDASAEEDNLSMTEVCRICGQFLSESHACLENLPSSLLTLQDPRLGMIVGGHFVLEEYIGASDTSFVYKARHQLLNSYAAVKLAASPVEYEQFSLLRAQRAAQIASRLEHPNIVRCIELLCANRDAPILIMEWASGKSLSQVIAKEAPLAPARAVQIIEQLCDGLSYAHRQGVNHINLKPSGVIIHDWNDFEHARLLDFGIMKMLGPHEPGLELSSQHSKYSSPEEKNGQPPDERSTIYSLGAMLYEMLTGDVDDSAHDNKNDPRFGAPALVKVRPNLKEAAKIDEILFKSMANKPALRYQTLDELSAALAAAQVELDRIATAELIMQRRQLPSKVPQFSEILLVLIIVAALIVGFVGLNSVLPIQ